jgi:RNA polymerase sigma factor (sigma-70 family)
MSSRIEGFLIYFQSRSGEESKKELFNRIWYKYYRQVHFFSAGILKSRKADIEDAVQEIMLKVFKEIEKYNPRYSFSTWLFTIARNTCLNWVKKRDRIEAGIFKENAVKSGNSSPEEALLENNIRLKVERFIRNLPEQESQIACLRFYENMKIREISLVMQVPEGTVKYKIHNIRQNLKAFLLEEEYVN